MVHCCDKPTKSLKKEVREEREMNEREGEKIMLS